jgi:DNA polymerase eta
MPSLIDASSASPIDDHRVVLLLDLDCFYAQCACIRLGWKAEETPLALFQWNSVLAVTYPARNEFQIQRGDNWDQVRRKSNGKCICVHVPILKTDEEMSSTSEALAVGPSLEEEYDRIFVLTEQDQQIARENETDNRRFSTEGKACIECFRIASARIFACVRTFLDQAGLSEHVILERASIDEFFLDVTLVVVDHDNDHNDDDTIMKETVMIGEPQNWSSSQCSFSQSRLRRGCRIAHQIRKAVYDTLGFTMTAGISLNKTLAKLAASYGKPAGQAVCFAETVQEMLNNTKIKKCRHLGGKLGKSVQDLLPDNVPPTVGSIARHVSLLDLQQKLGNETAEWVFDLARGIDHEKVESKTQTSAVLTKSITAFKSLNFVPIAASGNGGEKHSRTNGHTLAEAHRWILLLAQEVVTRVERDSVRNRRYPRHCVVQYAEAQSQPSHKNNKSIRIPFPPERLTATQKVAQLVSMVPKAIQSKVGGNEKGKICRVHRVGLCATDFVSRVSSNTLDMDSFFASNTSSTPSDQTVPCSVQKNHPEHKNHDAVLCHERNASPVLKPDVVQADLEFARKLQASYDRENQVLHILDAGKKKKAEIVKDKVKIRRIDSFFQKKKC